MKSKNGMLFSAMIVFFSSMFLATTTLAISNTFKVYAAYNCDTTSTCTNILVPIPNVIIVTVLLLVQMLSLVTLIIKIIIVKDPFALIRLLAI